jgi:hypothetical protein
MLEALTNHDWLSVNEYGLVTLHTFRANDYGLIVRYIQFPYTFPVEEAQAILSAPEEITMLAIQQFVPGSNSSPGSGHEADSPRYKRSKEYYLKETEDGYQLDINKNSYVKFSLSPENKLIRVVRRSFFEIHIYNLHPIEKINLYNELGEF